MVVEHNAKTHKSASAGNRFPPTELFWKDGLVQSVHLIKIQKDSLYFHDINDSVGLYRRRPLADLAQMSLPRHASLKKLIFASAIIGGVGMALGLISGDDEPGWFSMTAEEKAQLLGLGLFASSMYIGGSIQIARATDVDVPLKGIALQKRREIIQKIIDGKYLFPHPLGLSVSVNYLKFEDGLTTSGNRFSLRLQSKPRFWLALNYGNSSWSDWIVKEKHQYSSETSVRKEKRKLSYWSFDLRAFFPVQSVLHPYFEWGLLYGKLRSMDYEKITHSGSEQGVDYYIYQEEKSGIGIPLGIGFMAPLNRVISVDAQIGRLLVPGVPWRFELSVQIKN